RGGTCGARELRRLHRRGAVGERIHRRAGGGRVRGRERGARPSGCGRHARRNRQGGQDARAREEGPAGGRAGRQGRLLLMAVDSPAIVLEELRPEHWPDVARIYADGISTGNATFETDVPEWERWDRAHLAEHR